MSRTCGCRVRTNTIFPIAPGAETNAVLDPKGEGLAHYWTSRSVSYLIPVGIKSSTQNYTFEWLMEYPASRTDSFPVGESLYYFDVQFDRTLIGHNNAAEISFYDGAWQSTGYDPFGKGLQHCVLVLDGDVDTATFYVNGTQQYTGSTYTGRSFTSSNATVFGRYVSSGTPNNPQNSPCYFFKIYERALSASAVRALYADPYQFLIPA